MSRVDTKTRFLRAFVRADEGSEQGTPLHFVASTSNVARDGLVINSDAWELDNYRKNPVVLWTHDYLGFRALPIGRAEGVEVRDDELHADVIFDPDDDFAQQIERKYRTGFLNAVSVGWDTHEMKIEPDGDQPPIVTRAELLDISSVPVPGDPDALLERHLRALKILGIVPGADPAEIEARAGAVLSTRNREELERAIADLNGARDRIAEVLKRAEKEENDDKDDRGKGADVLDFLTKLDGRLAGIAPAN